MKKVPSGNLTGYDATMQRGFTLIELAIVLVIIGLLVGGVLVGQDLVKSAAINAVVKDLDSYNAAAATFRDKYRGIPGDLTTTRAQQFALTVSATNPGTTGEGDGNGLLANGAYVGGSGNETWGLGGENTLFWRQLSDAQLIQFGSSADGTTIDTTGFINSVSTTVTTLTPLIPKLRLRDTGFIHISSISGVSYYMIGQWTHNGNTHGWMAPDLVLTPREAYAIDAKMDDGMAATGTILSIAGDLTNGAPFNGGPNCYAPATGAYATTTEALANTISCALRIKTGF